jgi:gentisate 1,2-dioxygenase
MIANDSLPHLYDDLSVHAAAPLWTNLHIVNPRNPDPKAIPYCWKYAEMRPLLERSGALVDPAEAERRVLMLLNPGNARIPFTTDTLYAGLQMILPNEIAPAHRHVAFALRFIIEGEGAYTTVGGEKVIMKAGDVVLNPPFEYHDHGNESSEPMVWLDGLDVALFQWLPVHFSNGYQADRFPSRLAAQGSYLRYPWDEMQARLDKLPAAHAHLPYIHRRSGGPVSATIGASAERLDAGAKAEQRRETASSIYHVRAGRGHSAIGDATIVWEPGDTIAVPAWMPYEHHNDGNTTAYLFRLDDVPLLQALGLYRNSLSSP